MTADVEPSAGQNPAMRTIMPPYLLLRDFLDEATVAGLLDFALAHQENFEPTKTGGAPAKTGDAWAGAVYPHIRISLSTRDLGPFRRAIKDKMQTLLPDLIAKLGATPVEAPRFEIELVAHNDGAFYKRHIDTRTASDVYQLRILSAVYYFHAEPKAFSGGALRLYAIGNPAAATFIDIEPEQNTLLVFPSWAPHEVMPISCPSKRFADSRFAINCWVHRVRV